MSKQNLGAIYRRWGADLIAGSQVYWHFAHLVVLGGVIWVGRDWTLSSCLCIIAYAALALASGFLFHWLSVADPGFVPLPSPANAEEGTALPQPPPGCPNWCSSCHMLRPVRSKHCKRCGRCIYRYDHHCPWIGRCVGRYNHRLFWTYLLVDMTTSVFAFLRLVAGIGVVPTQLSWLVANAPTLLLLPFIFFNGFFIISLLWSHTGTALTGITGWEAMKHANIWYLSDMPQGFNPFAARPCCTNAKEFFCGDPRTLPADELPSTDVLEVMLQQPRRRCVDCCFG